MKKLLLLTSIIFLSIVSNAQTSEPLLLDYVGQNTNYIETNLKNYSVIPTENFYMVKTIYQGLSVVYLVDKTRDIVVGLIILYNSKEEKKILTDVFNGITKQENDGSWLVYTDKLNILLKITDDKKNSCFILDAKI